jgi:tetratricopeptide (TPR) repeat protein
MNRTATLFGLFLLAAAFLWAEVPGALARADALHDQEAYEASRDALETALGQAATPAAKAEVYWRLARAWLNIGDQAEERGTGGEALLAYYERAQQLAQKAIDADPANHLGYYWLSATIGRWGQVKGILNALSKAKPIRDLLQQALQLEPEHADSYYVLGQLYERLPGFPLSFGDKDYAVSLGRKAVDLHAEQLRDGREKKLNYDFYTQLAKHLWERNWSAARRQREQKRKLASFRAATDPVRAGFCYEGTVVLEELSDREEARGLVAWVVGQMSLLGRLTGTQSDDLKEARELLAAWR